jgi:hypothetical protein
LATLPNSDICSASAPNACVRQACNANAGCGAGEICGQFVCDGPTAVGRCVPAC